MRLINVLILSLPILGVGAGCAPRNDGAESGGTGSDSSSGTSAAVIDRSTDDNGAVTSIESDTTATEFATSIDVSEDDTVTEIGQNTDQVDSVAISTEDDSGDGNSQVDVTLDEEIVAVPAVNSDAPVTVELGNAEITAGIPGTGDLTNEQIKSWLDNPANHQVIDPQLPFGLRAAKSSIKGIDSNPMTRAKIELGRQLYFDTRLSSDNTISCASCHHPDEGYGRQTQFGVGVGGQTGGRNSPISYNRILSGPQFWDGRADSLEAQAVGPIANPIEMGNTHEAAVKTVSEIEGYRMQFEKIFDDGVNIDNIGKAIATFERAIVTAPAPYDHYERARAIVDQFGGEDFDAEELKEEDPELYDDYMAAVEATKPMSESARRGRDLFFSEKVGCTACHAGANFTDEQYHNLGVGMDADEPDLGRFVVSNEEKDKGAFKTPTIRNVALSAPYMHDGSQATLQEVVEWYNKGGHPNPHLSDKVKKIGLTDQEVLDLVNFMTEGLTSAFPQVEQGRLPL